VVGCTSIRLLNNFPSASHGIGRSQECKLLDDNSKSEILIPVLQNQMGKSVDEF